MIIAKEIEINGQTYKKTYSSKGFYIIKEGTEEKFEFAIDIPESQFVYIETNEISPYAEKLAMRSLSKREVFLAIYRDKGITPEQIKAQITDPSALIEFEYATEYFRGNPLINSIGALLGYTEDNIDYLFEYKEFPKE